MPQESRVRPASNPRFSKSYEYYLIREWRHNPTPEIGEKIVKQFHKFVCGIALRQLHKTSHHSIDDLIQFGFIGLFEGALPRFNMAQGNRFSTYATHWVRKEISDSIDNTDRTIRLPVHLHQKYYHILQAITQHSKRHGNEPTHQEIAAATGLQDTEVGQILTVTSAIISLDLPIRNADGTKFIVEFIPALEEDPLATFILSEEIEWLYAAISCLAEREQVVLILRYGLDGKDARSLRQTGVQLKLSHECVRQAETRALNKLRALLGPLPPP